MSTPLAQHQVEILSNRQAWQRKKVLQEIYRGFYALIGAQLDHTLRGMVLEIGSGIGNLKSQFPEAICSDLFPNPWLDLVCDGYEIPFQAGTLSHVVLFDVFHHLEAPFAFLEEAARVLCPKGRVIIFDPYISAVSRVAYGFFHHEPIAMENEIKRTKYLPRPRHYYAAQGNFTRLFFDQTFEDDGWNVIMQRTITSFAYLLSGGFSKPEFYPQWLSPAVKGMDKLLSAFPRITAARGIAVIEKSR